MQNFRPEFWHGKKVVALSGGIGGARLIDGLYQLLPADSLDVIINTGDDFEHLSVFVAPDCDTVMYTLANLAPVDRGWGVVDDSDQAMRMVETLGETVWFNLGDRDLGTNLLRTHRLRQGETLSEITDAFRKNLGLRCTLRPMADTPHPTIIHTRDGRALSFQEWLVGERGGPAVQRVELRGDKTPAPGILQCLEDADLIVIPPSNPWVSVDPILQLRGVRERVAAKPVIGVSPIIGRAAVKGPLAEMIESLLGREPSAEAAASSYHDLLDQWFVAQGDRFSAREERFAVVETDILMQGVEGRRRLARELLAHAQSMLA